MKFRMLHGDGLTGFGNVEHEVHTIVFCHNLVFFIPLN